jgi:PKD repeat protein
MAGTTSALPTSLSTYRWQPSSFSDGGSSVIRFTPISGGQSPFQNSLISVTDVSDADTNAVGGAWIPLEVPANAVFVSFDFQLEGDPGQDSFVAALAGTNVFSTVASLVGTGAWVNSGPISVQEYAGQTVELFLGVIGGTSSNLAVSVKNLDFIVTYPPQASFMPSPVAGGSPLWVGFTESSYGIITNLQWDFGDGTISNALPGDVSHIYDLPGQYSVRLIVTGPSGSDTNLLQNVITVWTDFQAWLDSYALPTDGTADFIDSDGDGANNWQEFVAGTNPVEVQSVLRITSVAQNGTGVEIHWQSSSGKLYKVQRSTNLDWTVALTLSNGISATPPVNSFTDFGATNGTKFFYRVGVEQ